MSTTKNSQKDVIYIDVDDEITGIISKLQESASKIVVLVLPKRAAVLQSIVNLKLLKRTADETKKNLVLITSEAAILPLAGAVGVHVARTLQSKPAIPSAPKPLNDTVELDAADVEDAELDVTKPIGVLAGMPAMHDEETIEMDDDEELPDAAAAAAKKPRLNKKLKVPNFDTFRTRLILGVAAVILLVGGWFVAFQVLPQANIVVKTNNTTVTSNLTLTVSPTAKKVDEANMIVPGLEKQLKKTDSQKIATTGTKDQGTKASGDVTLSLKDCSQAQVTVPAGTAISSSGFSFVTQADVTMQRVLIGNTCYNSSFPQNASAKVKVVAEKAGDQYNLSARSYTVNGFSTVAANGGAMTGGTSNIVKVVGQQDLDTAKQKVVDANNASVTQDISQQLKNDGYIPIVETLSAGDPVVVATPNVGEQADEVSVNVTVTYAMTGIKQDGVKQLLENDIKKHIDTSKQNILNDGLDKAIIHAADNKKANGEVKITLQTNAEAGVQQNADEIKRAVAGKKKGEVQAYILARPGVKDVDINYSPFWIYRTTKSLDKITVTFQQADGNTSTK